MYVYIPRELCETIIVSATWIIGIKMVIGIVNQMVSKVTHGTRK